VLILSACAPAHKMKPEFPKLLSIQWAFGPRYPMGVQLSAVDLLEGNLISVGGATRYPKDIVARYPDAFGGAAQGATSFSFALDTEWSGADWTRIPDMPGPRRETGMAVTVDDELYVFGGFTYSPPYTLRDAYRLRRRRGGWVWETLPAELPWPVCQAGIAAVGSRIYMLGGADFYAEGDGKPDFFTDSSRDGHPVGVALLMLDTNYLTAGWRELASLPGTSRFDQSFAAVGNRLYTLAGNHRGRNVRPMQCRNVADAWVYDIGAATWSRLPDAPVGANTSAIAWRDYVILTGGFRYGETLHLDGRRTETYSQDEKKLAEAKQFQSFVERSVFVFDTKHQRWGLSDSLPEQASQPMTAVSGNRIFVLGGEGGRLWHSDTLQIGTVEEVR
jgi:N-acetylneuraminic acid mutarotase